jgi:hypothetical protein
LLSDLKDKVGEIKTKLGETILQGTPEVCKKIYAHLEELKYDSVPDYKYLHSLFIELFQLASEPEDVPYDWNKSIVNRKPSISGSNEDTGIGTSVENIASSVKKTSAVDLVESLKNLDFNMKPATDEVSTIPTPHPPLFKPPPAAKLSFRQKLFRLKRN